MNVCKLIAPIAVLVMLVGLASCGGGGVAERERVDSLNALSCRVRYASLEQAMGYADSAESLAVAVGYRDGRHEAVLNKGDVYGMRMDYDSAQVCYMQVLDESNNELLRCMADVDMMSVCLMMARNKEFYDYRVDALECMADVSEEEGSMTERQRRQWRATQTEYHFVSANYFMKMRQDDGVSEEMEWLEKNKGMFEADTVQMSEYLFLRSMYDVVDLETADIAEETQRNLMRLMAMSRRAGNVYFEALALNGLARGVLMSGDLKPSRRVFLEELIGSEKEGEGDVGFAEKLAGRSLQLAEQYGNAFVQTVAMQTLSDCYLRSERDSLALAQMDGALELINQHHRRMTGSDEKLYAYSDVEDSVSTEMRWIANMEAVPEWMAMVREQLSVVYGAMGLKAESDYNHNIYFDILDVTRQDQRVAQEEDTLTRERQTLNVLLWVLVIVFGLLLWALLAYSRRSRLEYRDKVRMLERVIEICHRLPLVMSEDIEDEDDLDAAMHRVADEDVRKLFPRLEGEDWTMADYRTLKGMDGELLHVLQVFYGWMRRQGQMYLNFSEEGRKIESDIYLAGKRLEESKRQHVEKLTSMSIVNGITPFLDRAMHEVNKLKMNADGRESAEQVHGRLVYLGELIDKINEYNDVLGHWVKIRQGMVALNVENFALQPLFDTLGRGARTFEAKGITLALRETECVVKADKALTLFMINTLLDNARKYTPEGGNVSLWAEETDAYVEVSVSDTGHGLSVEDVDVINNSKVYDSSKIGAEGEHSGDIIRNKGFGFGLMNCRGIIGKYKKTNAVFNVCDFGVESEKDKGSRFFFRLPKGVLKAVVGTLLMFVCGNAVASDNLERAVQYADSIYSANVNGEYSDAVLFADSAIYYLNEQYMTVHPDGRQLMCLEGAGMAELEWWKDGIETDYELIIKIRNEVAIAALALNRNSLYHYNSEVFTRLYKLLSTDPALEDYCNEIKAANRNKKTVLILLGVLIFVMAVVYFLFRYRHHQLFIFNLRQFIQLNNTVFTSTSETLPKVLLQNLSDIKQADGVGLMVRSEGKSDKCDFMFAGNVAERDAFEGFMRSAYEKRTEVSGADGEMRAYPLYAPDDEELPLGVMGVHFCNGDMSAEEELIVRLVVQFIGIHTYYSRLKVEEMEERIEQKKEECLRIESEQQQIYVRNQIMDNCLSALKHETMYYPNRIKQIVDVAMSDADRQVEGTVVNDIDELLSYYKEVFSILSSCAGKQVEKVLFRRTTLSNKEIGKMAEKSFNRQKKKSQNGGVMKVVGKQGLSVQCDKIFIQILIDNIISLYFEHNADGDMLLDFEVSDGFAKFVFSDTAYRYNDEEIPLLFYVDNVKYDALHDRLVGSQYLLCRQIIREHDAHSSVRGCRIYVENNEDGRGSRFVFTLPLSFYTTL